MANFWCVFISFCLNCGGVYTFRNAEENDSFPYITYLIFLSALFVLLCDTCVYPSSFPVNYFIVKFLIEFPIVMFLMEFLMVDFCLPIEKMVVSSIPKVAEGIEYLFTLGNFCEIPAIKSFCDLLKSDDTVAAASYVFSICCLITILHVTRAVNLSILQCDGVAEFFNDTKKRAQKFLLKNVNFNSGCRCRYHAVMAQNLENQHTDELTDNDANNEINFRNNVNLHNCKRRTMKHK